MAARQPSRLRRADAALDLNARRTQLVEPTTRNARIWIFNCNDGALDPRRDDGVGAGTGSPLMRARLERHIDRRPPRPVAGRSNCDRLGVRPAAPRRRRSCDDFARRCIDNHRADGRIGRRIAKATLGHAQRDRHHLGV